MQNSCSTSRSEEIGQMEVLAKLTQNCLFLRGKSSSVKDASKKAKNANAEETQTKPAELKGVPLMSAPLRQDFFGIFNEAQLAKVAVAAAAATAERGVCIPSSHCGTASASLMKQCQKIMLSSVVLVAKPPPPNDNGIPTSGLLGVRSGDSPLKRCGKAIGDLQTLLESHDVDYPSYVDDEQEEDAGGYSPMETIWEEDEDELEEDART